MTFIAPGNYSAHIRRRMSLVGRQIIVVDGLFSNDQVASTYDFLLKQPYRLNDIASEETAYVRHLKAEFPVALAAHIPVLRDCVTCARALLVPIDFQLNRAYSNMIFHGDLQGPHTDIAGGITALYYANPIWEENWIAETVFYDENREATHAIAPKPGRIVIFHSDILHRAGVPSRECPEPRVSVALLFC